MGKMHISRCGSACVTRAERFVPSAGTRLLVCRRRHPDSADSPTTTHTVPHWRAHTSAHSPFSLGRDVATLLSPSHHPVLLSRVSSLRQQQQQQQHPLPSRRIMADVSTCPPLTRAAVQAAHARIAPHIHRTPVVTCATIDRVASTPQRERSPELGPVEAGAGARPTIRVFFKCENQQRIGAFKARGAFHALGRLIEEKGIEEVRRKGVVTHSSGKDTCLSCSVIFHAEAVFGDNDIAYCSSIPSAVGSISIFLSSHKHAFVLLLPGSSSLLTTMSLSPRTL